MFVSPTSRTKRRPTASTAFRATHITRCWSYSSGVSSANASTPAAPSVVSEGPMHARSRPICGSSAASASALGITEQTLRSYQQEADHQSEHRDGRVRQIEEISSHALDRRDQEAAENRAGYAAQSADDDDDERLGQVIAAQRRGDRRQRRHQSSRYR